MLTCGMLMTHHIPKRYHWMPALYTSWLNSMHDEQVEPSHKCAAATGSQGDTNVVNGKPDCTGAVGDLTPGPTPAALPGDPSWMFVRINTLYINTTVLFFLFF